MPDTSSQTRLSRMTDRAAQLLLETDQPLDSVASVLVQEWPLAPALEIGLAIASACDAIEQMYLPHAAMSARVAQGWRMAALIGGDVLALQMQGRPHQHARDLLAWWSAP